MFLKSAEFGIQFYEYPYIVKINNYLNCTILMHFWLLPKDFPGLDSLSKYDVSITESGGVRVRAKKSMTGNRRKLLVHEREDIDTTKDRDDRHILIVGGGGAAQTCVETLRTRQNDPWRGKITVLTAECCLPYDRPKLSKVYIYSTEC